MPKKGKLSKGAKTGKRSPKGVVSMSVPIPAAKSTITTNRSKRSINLTNREYVADVAASTIVGGSTWTDLRINPGNSNMFPWLSQLARCYEYYSFHSLEFEYVASCPTSVNGTVAMAIDYDPEDSHPEDLQTLMVMDGAVSCQSYSVARCRATPKHMHVSKDRYVSTSSAAVGDRWTDVGRFYSLSTGSSAGGATLGQIYATYSVTLSAPQIPEPDDTSITLVAKNSITIPAQTNIGDNWEIESVSGSSGSAGLAIVGGALNLLLPRGSWWSDLTSLKQTMGRVVMASRSALSNTQSMYDNTSTDGSMAVSSWVNTILASAPQYLPSLSKWLTAPVSAFTPINLLTAGTPMSIEAGVTKLILNTFRNRRTSDFTIATVPAAGILMCPGKRYLVGSVGCGVPAEAASTEEAVSAFEPCRCAACKRVGHL